MAARLARFRFATDLRALADACRAQSQRTSSAVAGPLTALAE